MSDFKSYRSHSKDNYGNLNKDAATLEQINTGSLQRIADATEAMAQNFVKLQNDYEYMRKSRDNYREDYRTAQRQITALKGHITRLKKKQTPKN
jgi:hypothetical protein